MHWKPPGKNCGMCGSKTCNEFIGLVKKGEKTYSDCPFYQKETVNELPTTQPQDSKKDILGLSYDFILEPLPKEVSARKIILPFRPDLVEKWNIETGDIIVGRPTGSGCPVQHVLKVIDANKTTGVLTTWVVGPKYSRGKRFREIKEIEAYHVIGFEGIAKVINKEPVFGARQRFLPGNCMMQLGHTGVVNTILNKKYGTHIRIEDIRL